MSRAEGTWGEAEVANYLRRRGYTLLAHGFHCRFGEIDLIARKDGVLCFVVAGEYRGRQTFYRLEQLEFALKLGAAREIHSVMLEHHGARVGKRVNRVPHTVNQAGMVALFATDQTFKE